MNVHQIINKIVIDCLRQHTGGPQFFTEIDKRFQDKNIVNELLTKASLRADRMNEYASNRPQIIMSGRFGIFVNNLIGMDEAGIDFPFNHFVVNGSLRGENPVVKVLEYAQTVKHDYFNNKFVFIDDSFYSGKTRNAIKAFLALSGLELAHTYVVYDGSKIQDPGVSSLYRYYDNFSREE